MKQYYVPISMEDDNGGEHRQWIEYATMPQYLVDEIQADAIMPLLVALHDAIDRPKGVVPASADPFYDPTRYTK